MALLRRNIVLYIASRLGMHPRRDAGSGRILSFLPSNTSRTGCVVLFYLSSTSLATDCSSAYANAFISKIALLLNGL